MTLLSKEENKNFQQALSLIRLNRTFSDSPNPVQEKLANQLKKLLFTSEKNESQPPFNHNKSTFLHLKIRQLVASNSKWELLVPLFQELLETEISDNEKIKLIEIAFLSSSRDQLESFITSNFSQLLPVLIFVHKSVRSRILFSFHGNKKQQELIQKLKEHKWDLDSEPIEEFYILDNLVKHEDKDSYKYYHKVKENIKILAKNSLAVENLCDRYIEYLHAHCLWIEKKFHECRNILLSFPKENKYFPLAVKLFHQLPGSGGQKYENKDILIQLKEEEDQVKQIEILKSFYKQNLHEPSATFMQFASKPTAFLKDNALLFNSFSSFLKENRMEFQKLSVQFGLLLENRLKCYDKNIEHALWSPWLEVNVEESDFLGYKILANCHVFVLDPQDNLHLLWELLKLKEIERDTALNSNDLKMRWSFLINWIKKQINENQNLSKIEKETAIATVFVFAEKRLPSYDYLLLLAKRLDAIPRFALEILSQMAFKSAKEPKQFELWKFFENHVFGWTNKELRFRLLSAARCDQHDFFYRTLSVLFARNALNSLESKILSHSLIEKNRSYSFEFAKISLDMCLFDFDQPRIDLIENMIPLAGNIANVFHKLGNTVKWSNHSNDGFQFKELQKDILQKLYESGIFQKSRMKCRDKEAEFKLPLYPKLASIYHVLGVDNWNGDKEYFLEQVALLEKTRPDGISGILGKDDSLLESWYKELSVENQRQWQNLIKCVHSLNSNELQQTILEFSLKIYLIMVPEYSAILNELQKIDVSLDFYRKIESFIISDKMTKIRSENCVVSLDTIPKSFIEDDFNKSILVDTLL